MIISLCHARLLLLLGMSSGGMCMALASCTHDGRPYVYVGMESGSVGLFDLAEQRCCGVAGAGLQVLPCPLLGLATSPFKK